MKTSKIISLFPDINPVIDDADKVALAEAINTALESGATAADIAPMIEGAGADAGEASDQADEIFAAFEVEKKAKARNKKIAAGMSTFQKWLVAIAAIATFVLLYLAIATPWVTKADLADLATAQNVTDATAPLAKTDDLAPLAKTDDLATLTTTMAGRFDNLDTATSGLVKKSDFDIAIAGLAKTADLAPLVKKSDFDIAIAGLAKKSDLDKVEAIVTTGLTYRARCKKGSTEPTCIACFGGDTTKRCYYRKAFQAASAYSVRKATKPCPEKVEIIPPVDAATKSTPDKVEDSRGGAGGGAFVPKTAPIVPPKASCPKGCVPGCPCDKSGAKTTTHRLDPVERG